MSRFTIFEVTLGIFKCIKSSTLKIETDYGKVKLTCEIFPFELFLCKKKKKEIHCLRFTF